MGGFTTPPILYGYRGVVGLVTPVPFDYSLGRLCYQKTFILCVIFATIATGTFSQQKSKFLLHCKKISL